MAVSKTSHCSTSNGLASASHQDTLLESHNSGSTFVQNPLSHSQVVDVYRREIEDAIFAVDELEMALLCALQPPNPALPVLRQMLVDRLAQRIERLLSAAVTRLADS